MNFPRFQRTHPAEFEQYYSLTASQSQSPHSSDIQQSIVSTIKSETAIRIFSEDIFTEISLLFFYVGEEMEFIDVNQDDMPDDTWDSFESSFDFNEEDSNIQQANIESAATSTTKNLPLTSQNGISFLIRYLLVHSLPKVWAFTSLFTCVFQTKSTSGRINLTILTMTKTAPPNRATMNQSLWSNCCFAADFSDSWGKTVLQCRPNVWAAKAATCTMVTSNVIQISWSIWV